MQALVEPIPGSNALETFCRQDGPQREFNGELRSILETIAKTGKYWHNWSQLKTLLCFRLAQVMQEYHASNMHVDDSATDLVHGERFTDVLDRLLQGLDSFTEGAPFTCQRLCELLLNPKDTYVNLDKLSLAFEKLLLVTSTEPASTDPYPLTPQPPTKPTEVLEKEQVADEILPDALPVNGSHEPNGSHKDVQDEEMVDVAIVDRPVEEVVVLNQPAVSEGFAVANDSPEKLGPEDAANGHIGTSGDEMAGDMTLEETKPE